MKNAKRHRKDARATIKNIRLNKILDPPITPRLIPKNPKLSTREDLWKWGEIGNTFPLMPNEEYPFPAVISNKEYSTLNEKPYFIGLHIAYKVNDQFSTIGKIWEIKQTVISPIDSWVNKEPE